MKLSNFVIVLISESFYIWEGFVNETEQHILFQHKSLNFGDLLKHVVARVSAKLWGKEKVSDGLCFVQIAILLHLNRSD